MTLHLIKLCVGAESIADLAQWQKQRAAERRKSGGSAAIMHFTRMTPKRVEELLDGGSLYWVIKGQIAARQRLIAIKPVTREGVPHCALVLDKRIVATIPRKHRAFQGWRYLEIKSAPGDLAGSKAGIPEKLRAELTELGLL